MILYSRKMPITKIVKTWVLKLQDEPIVEALDAYTEETLKVNTPGLPERFDGNGP